MAAGAPHVERELGQPERKPKRMPASIVLLTRKEIALPLAAALMGIRPSLNVINAETLTDLNALRQRLLRHARLIGFATPVIVPPRVLGALGFGAYNFHPGPPSYPGWAPYCFAVYEQAKQYGVTAHAMSEEIDTGPIIGTKYFPLRPGTTAKELNRLALVSMTMLFRRLAFMLATCKVDLPALAIEWGPRKTTRADLAEMCNVPVDASKEELNRRVAAFALDDPDFPALVFNGTKLTSCAI